MVLPVYITTQSGMAVTFMCFQQNFCDFVMWLLKFFWLSLWLYHWSYFQCIYCFLHTTVL